MQSILQSLEKLYKVLSTNQDVKKRLIKTILSLLENAAHIEGVPGPLKDFYQVDRKETSTTEPIKVKERFMEIVDNLDFLESFLRYLAENSDKYPEWTNRICEIITSQEKMDCKESDREAIADNTIGESMLRKEADDLSIAISQSGLEAGLDNLSAARLGQQAAISCLRQNPAPASRISPKLSYSDSSAFQAYKEMESTKQPEQQSSRKRSPSGPAEGEPPSKRAKTKADPLGIRALFPKDVVTIEENAIEINAHLFYICCNRLYNISKCKDAQIWRIAFDALDAYCQILRPLLYAKHSNSFFSDRIRYSAGKLPQIFSDETRDKVRLPSSILQFTDSCDDLVGVLGAKDIERLKVEEINSKIKQCKDWLVKAEDAENFNDKRIAIVNSLTMANNYKLLPEIVQGLTLMGDIFFAKARDINELDHNVKAEDCLTASKFYHSALNIAQKEKIAPICDLHAKISAIETQLLFILNPNTSTEDTNLYKGYSSIISSEWEEIDKNARNSLEKLDEYVEDNLEAQYLRAQEINRITREVSEGIKLLVRKLADHCSRFLSHQFSDFAFAALGSLAKGSATPRSDLEFIALLEDDEVSSENVQYVKDLCYLMCMKVISLGQTALPENSFKTEGISKINFDRFLPKGFQFDLGGKTPLGRNDNKRYSLIRSIPQMLEYLDDDAFIKIDKLLPIQLTNVCYLYGKPALVDRYQTEMQIYMRHNVNERNRAIRILRGNEEKLAGDLKAFKVDLDRTSEEGKLLNVKSEIYRLPDRLIEALALFFSVYANSNDEKITRLLNGNRNILVHGNTYKLISIMNSIANELRLRTYIKNGGQHEQLIAISVQTNILNQNKKLAQFFGFEDWIVDQLDKLLLRYYSIALPFYNAVVEFTSGQNQYLSLQSLPDETYTTKGLIYKRLLLYAKAEECFAELCHDKNDADAMLHLAYTQLMQSKYKEAELSFKQIVDDKASKPGQTIMLAYCGLAAVQEEARYLDPELYTRKNAVSYLEKAFQCAEQIKDIAMMVRIKSKLAILRNNPSNPAAKEALQLIKENPFLEGTIEEVKARTALALCNYEYEYVLAAVIRSDSRKKRQDAINDLFSITPLLEKLYGDQPHPEVAQFYQQLGQKLKEIEEYQLSEKCYLRSILIWETLFGQEIPHIKYIDAVRDLAVLYSAWNLSGQAAYYYHMVVSLEERYYKDELTQARIGNIQNLADLYLAQGDLQCSIYYARLAVQLYQNLNERESDRFQAGAISIICEAYMKLNEQKNDRKYLEQELYYRFEHYKLHREISGETNIKTITSLENLGTVYYRLGQNKDALYIHNMCLAYYLMAKCEEESRRIDTIYKADKYIMYIIYHIAEDYKGIGDYGLALTCCSKVLAMKAILQSINSGPLHPQYASLEINTMDGLIKCCNFCLQERNFHPKVIVDLKSLVDGWQKIKYLNINIAADLLYCLEAIKEKPESQNEDFYFLPHYISFWYDLGVISENLKQPEMAMEFYKLVLHHYRSKLQELNSMEEETTKIGSSCFKPLESDAFSFKASLSELKQLKEKITKYAKDAEDRIKELENKQSSFCTVV